ncbi:MAG: hypothetical protein WBX01_12210 [Nitrososphaeraceae archaeon]
MSATRYCRDNSGSSDDNVASNLWSHQKVGSWMQLDRKKICRVDIAWRHGDMARNNFVITVSNDTTLFTEKISMTSETAAPSYQTTQARRQNNR